MTLEQARKLRDHLKDHGIKATVPLGYSGDEYFVLAKMKHESSKRSFQTLEQWRDYARAENQRIVDFCRQHGVAIDTRTPIERMIDEAACGVKP